MALKRSFFEIKSAVGVSKATKDVDFKMCETKLKESEKKLKQAFQVASKLPETVQAINVMHTETLRSFVDCVPDDLECQSLINEVTNIFISMDSGCEGYKTVLNDQLVQPLSLYLDQWNVLRKRIKTLDQRRVDMDRYHERVLSITKKAPGKQSGLADAQAKYSFARDSYYFLRNEIMEDVAKINNDIGHIVRPMISTLLVSYTEYLNNVNSYWGAVPNILQKLPPGGFEIQALYTPNEFSMISETNVTNKRRDEGPTPDDDMATTSQQAAAPAPTQNKRPPPPPPSRAPAHQVVICEYDYDAQDATELSFKQGDRITVLKKEGDWWEGQTEDGRVGLFPSNYVRVI